MRNQLTPKSIRRLIAADGYLTLSLPEKAIDELLKTGEMGPLEGPRRLLMGLAHRMAGNDQAAIPHLELAARKMPSPARRFAWSELAGCYRTMGSDGLAEVADQLGGDTAYELKICLPFGELHLQSSEAASESLSDQSD